MEFEDCGNIRLPVDSTVLMDELINFRDSESGDTIERQVEVLSEIIDSISDNPRWSLDIPINLNVKLSIDKNVIKKIPFSSVFKLFLFLQIEFFAFFVINKKFTIINSLVKCIHAIRPCHFYNSIHKMQKTKNQTILRMRQFQSCTNSFCLEK
jgi:hypothetical protein